MKRTKINLNELREMIREIINETTAGEIRREKSGVKRIYEDKLSGVKQDGLAIRYIQNPSEKLQLAAVKENGSAIEYIKNPSEEVQLAAVKQNRRAIQYIPKPHPSVLKYLEGNNANINENTSLIRSAIKDVLNEYKWVKW